jgi:hypothetical protein
VLVSFQSTESLGRLQYAAGGPAQCHRSILPSFHVAADALGAVSMSACAVRRAGSR